MKVHLGCGDVIFDGFINVDPYSAKAQVKMTAQEYMKGLPNNSLDRVEWYHVIEHMHRNEAKEVVRLVFSKLKSGGVFVTECPNFRRTVEEYLAGHKSRLNNVYGHQRYPGDQHCWGYDDETLPKLMRWAGFTVTHVGEGTDRHIVWEPCLRVEATKP